MGTQAGSSNWTIPVPIAARTGFSVVFPPKKLLFSSHSKRKSTLTYSVTACSCLSPASTASASIRAPSSSNLENLAVGETDLLVVGPGVLGRLIAKQWRQEHPESQVYGQTLTTNHHDELMKMGIIPFLKENKPSSSYPFVIFCAPPYGNPDYPGTVRDSMMSWNGEGSFIFTSSSATFDVNDNGPCDEDSPAVPLGRSPRIDNLLLSGKEVLERNGCVVRLAGLYDLDRGAHMFWLKKGTSDTRPDHIVNLIHYEDAASLCIAISKKKLRNRIFMGCDNHPLSRGRIMELVAQSGKFSGKFEGFTGTSDPLGKRMNNSKTREEIGWEPKYQSFAQYLDVCE